MPYRFSFFQVCVLPDGPPTRFSSRLPAGGNDMLTLFLPRTTSEGRLGTPVSVPLHPTGPLAFFLFLFFFFFSPTEPPPVLEGTLSNLFGGFAHPPPLSGLKSTPSARAFCGSPCPGGRDPAKPFRRDPGRAIFFFYLLTTSVRRADWEDFPPTIFSVDIRDFFFPFFFLYPLGHGGQTQARLLGKNIAFIPRRQRPPDVT